MKRRFSCAACGEDLRGRKSSLLRGRPICEDPCGKVSRKKNLTYGALQISGADLICLFIEEADRWEK